MHWLLHVFGLDTASSRWSLWWSGSGADLGELAIIGGMIGAYHKHNCHAKGCWRVGRHTVDGTPWCNRHHEAARNAGRG